MRLQVNGWDTGLRFSAAHFIPSHDKCSRLHGHDYAVDLSIEGSENGGFIIDFDLLKALAREVLYPMDHKVLVPSEQDIVKHAENASHVKIEYGEKSFTLAREDVYYVPGNTTSSEQLAQGILDKLSKKITDSKNIREIEVCVYEGPGQGACASRTING